MNESTQKNNQENSEPIPQENFVSINESLLKDTYVSNVELNNFVSINDLESTKVLTDPKIISDKNASQNEISNLLENKFVSADGALRQETFVSNNESLTFVTMQGIEITQDPVELISNKNATQNVVSNLINANSSLWHEDFKSLQGNYELSNENTESLHEKCESLVEDTESSDENKGSFHEEVETFKNSENNNTMANFTKCVKNENIKNRINAIKLEIEQENVSKLNRALPNQYIKEIPKQDVEELLKKFEENEKSNKRRMQKERIKKMSQFIDFSNNKTSQRQSKSCKRNGHYYNSPSIIIFKNDFKNKISEDNLDVIHHSSQNRFEGGLCAKKSKSEIMDCLNVCNCKFCEEEHIESEAQYQKMCQWIYNRGRSVMDRVKNLQLGPFKVGDDELMPSNYGCGWIVCRKPKKIRKSKYDIRPYDPLIMKRKEGGGNAEYESDEHLVKKTAL